MKTLWNVFCVMLVLHLLVTVAGIGWLWKEGRLNRERIHRVAAMFKTTIEEEKLAAAAVEAAAAEQKQAQLELVRLEQVSRGPTTVADRLSANQEVDEVSLQKITWLRRAVGDLTTRLESDKQQLQKLKGDLDKERAEFEKKSQARAQVVQDEDFQMAVKFYEQLKPKQTKVMFQEMMSQGRRQQVIDYLASMQLRKAAAVLSEFKEGADVLQATDLLQGLRERGIDPMTRKVEPAQAAKGST